MKKLMVLAIIMIAAMAFSMEISRNRVMGMLGLGYTTTEVNDVPVTTMGLAVPDINYEFEAKPNDMFKIYLYGELGYMMDKVSVDGEAADAWSGSTLMVALNPAAKVYLPNNLFAKVALPFEYSSYTSDLSGAEAVPVQGMDAEISFGFDNREIYIHGLTPFDKFEKGIIAYGFYNMGLMYSVDGTDAEELPTFAGFYGAYAHYADAMMIKPYLKYEMGMNDKVDENGYLNVGVDFVKDFNEKLNLEAGLDFAMKMLPEEDPAGNSSYNELLIDAMASYYVMPELAIGGGLGMWMDMTTEDANPVYMIMLGAEYTLNLLK